MKKMLDILLHKSDVAFRHLVDALRQVNRRLAGLLEHGASGEEEPGKVERLHNSLNDLRRS